MIRKFAFALALLGSTAALAGEIVMHRDPGCGCCSEWAKQVRTAFGQNVRIVDDNRRSILQQRAGMPANLASCHTAVIDGMTFEGHVPVADMKRLLASKPRGVRGLAVPGMPLGAPGMEVEGGPTQHYVVYAFGSGRPTVFARH